MVLPALGVETGVEPPRRSGGRLARFGRSATAAAAGDPFCDLGGALAELFVLVQRLRMLEGVSLGDGQNAEEPEKTDWARDRHGRDDSGRDGGGAAEKALVF